MNVERFERFRLLFRAGYLDAAIQLTLDAEAQVDSADDLARLGHCQLRIGLYEQAEQSIANAMSAGIGDAALRFDCIEDLLHAKQGQGKFDDISALKPMLQSEAFYTHQLRMYRADDPLMDVLRNGYSRLILDQPIEHTSVIILSRGGAGDVIEDIRYLEDLKAAGVAEIHFYPGYSMNDLLTNSRLPIDWAPFSKERLQRCRHIARLSDLAMRFGPRAEVNPAHRGYLRQVRAGARRIEVPPPRDRRSGVRKVGIVWRSDNVTNIFEPFRSMRLEQMTPILASPDIQFYSLQFGKLSRREAAILTVHGAIDMSPAIRSFADSASILEQLDLLITVDSSPGHLAGALDVPVWVMLTGAPDWRWGARTATTTHLYPSMRFFRQPTLGDWTPVVEHIAMALQGRESEVRT